MTAKNDATIIMNTEVIRDALSREKLKRVCEALLEKGYDPVRQIVGYLLTEDPTYITNHNSARTDIVQMDRDDLLHEIVGAYLAETVSLSRP